MNPDTQLRTALLKTRELYKIDSDLVRPGAAAHHVDVTEGNLTTPLSSGNYNARIPEGSPEEIEAIKNAQIISFQCEDYRQSAHLANHLGADVVFSTAGGAVQPDEGRRKAAVELAAAIHTVNPKAKFVFSFHTEVCGGAKYFTQGEMEKIYNTQGPEAELKAMTDFGMQFVREAIAAGVPKNRVELRAVKLESGGHIHAGQTHLVKEIAPIAIHNT